MNAQIIKQDRELISNFISDRARYQPKFISRFRERIYKTIDSINETLDKYSVINIEQKKSLLSDFIDYLFLDDAKRLKGYISSDSPPKKRNNRSSSLNKWIETYSEKFINAKLIIKGVLEKNQNVINNFVRGPKDDEDISSYSPPSCFPIILKMVRVMLQQNTTILEPEDISQELALALLQNEKLRNKFRNYRYNAEFYSYFKKYIFLEFYKKTRDSIEGTEIVNPIYPSKRIGEEWQEEEYESLSIEAGINKEELKKKLKKLKEASERDIAHQKRELKKKLEKLKEASERDIAHQKRELIDELNELKKKNNNSAIPRVKVTRQEITYSINNKEISSAQDSDLSKKYDDEAYRHLIERVLKKMSKTPKGRKQVEILKVLQYYYINSGEEKIKDKDIAEKVGMTTSNYSKEKKKIQKVVKQIAKENGIQIDI